MTKLRYSYSIDHPVRCDPDLFVKQQKILIEKYDAYIELTVIDSDTRMKTALLKILKVGKSRILVEDIGSNKRCYVKVNEKAQLSGLGTSLFNIIFYCRSSEPTGFCKELTTPSLFLS